MDPIRVRVTDESIKESSRLNRVFLRQSFSTTFITEPERLLVSAGILVREAKLSGFYTEAHRSKVIDLVLRLTCVLVCWFNIRRAGNRYIEIFHELFGMNNRIIVDLQDSGQERFPFLMVKTGDSHHTGRITPNR